MTEHGEMSDFDRWAAARQQAFLEREQALFSAKVLAEARHPKNIGLMLDPDGHALGFGSCGDTMEIFLRVRHERIQIAVFMTDGCGPTLACGSMLTQMAWGKRLEAAVAIEAADLILALDGLPPEHIHCATLAVRTLQEAIVNCRSEGKGEND